MTATIDTVEGTLPAPAGVEAAEATATATATEPQTGTQRVGVHGGTPAGAPSRTRAHVRARRLGAHVNAALRRDASHGAPWEERPMSLIGLREALHSRAAVHEALPLGKVLYLAWGYAFVFPVTIAGYTILWILQAPARTFTVVMLIAILHAFHLMPALPVIQTTPVIRSIF
jgi:hypothetical protein